MLSLDYCDIHSMSEVKEFVVLVDDVFALVIRLVVIAHVCVLRVL